MLAGSIVIILKFLMICKSVNEIQEGRECVCEQGTFLTVMGMVLAALFKDW